MIFHTYTCTVMCTYMTGIRLSRSTYAHAHKTLQTCLRSTIFKDVNKKTAFIILLDWYHSTSPYKIVSSDVAHSSNNYPARMRRGKVIIRVVVVAVDTKIAKSGDVCTWASCKHNKYVEFCEKLASICSESNGTACESHKSCILVGHHSHPYWLCPLCSMHVFSAHVHDWPSTCR